MNKKDRDRFKKILLEDKQKLLKHLEDISETSEAQMHDTSGDEADLASLEISQASLHKIGRREATLIKKIDKALVKIEDGTYGECENCGEEIAIGRLLARPVAQLCIDCKTEQENNEKRFQSDSEEEDFFSEGDDGAS